MEILTVHELFGKRWVELPEGCLPIAREVMLLPETTEHGPAWFLVIHDVVGRDWLAKFRRAAVATEPEPTYYNAATGTAIQLYRDGERPEGR